MQFVRGLVFTYICCASLFDETDGIKSLATLNDD